jgi:hypothetical protein
LGLTKDRVYGVNGQEFDMVDPNMRDFYGRVGRIERTHQQGGGFEAAGTLGMTYYNSLKVKRRRMTWLMPVALVFCTIVAIKAAVLANIGADTYTARIAALSGGDMADKIGAYILQADPLTQYLAGQIEKFPG